MSNEGSRRGRGPGRGRGRGQTVTPSVGGSSIKMNDGYEGGQETSERSSPTWLRGGAVESMEDASELDMNDRVNVSTIPPRRQLVPTISRTSTSSPVTGTSPLSPQRSKAVGGLLGSNGDYAKKPTGASKLKFVPNMKRRSRIIEDDEDDDVVIKAEPGSRTPGPKGAAKDRPLRAPRQEIEMKASGPMAYGPGEIAKTLRKGGAFGAAVMEGNSSEFALRQEQYLERDVDPDASDLESDDMNEEGNGKHRVWARELNDIGKEDEMAPMTLPPDPNVVKLATERRRIRAELRTNNAVLESRRENNNSEDVTMSSTSSPPTPNIPHSGTTTIERINLLNSNEPKPVDLKNDFLIRNLEERLYMFQFPRKFPHFVEAHEAKSAKAETNGMKSDLESNEVPDKTYGMPTPVWGRAGSRSSKSSRWGTKPGRIGKLNVHRSGKVTLSLNDDLDYEVLPAAQPSFLQEIAILDHDPANEPSGINGSAQPSDPNRSLLILGQTHKKFLVVPDVDQLLEALAEQEKDEKAKARKTKDSVKKEAW